MRADVQAWLSGWLTLILFIGVPLVTIATERSKKRAGRLIFAASLAATLMILSANDILWLFFDISSRPQYWTLNVLSVGAGIWFFRTLVQRLRDAGYAKGIAYLSCIPIANLLFFLFLLFPASKADVPAIKAFE
jgi:hypothetical protein